MNLFETRKSGGLSQAQLANLVGVSQSSITAYERGLRTPSPMVARRIAHALNLSIEQMWEMFYGNASGESCCK